MFRIENDYGTFEADTEKEALKLSRAAKRKAVAAERKAGAARAVASLKAKAKGFDILRHLADNGSVPKAWRIRRPGENRFPSAKLVGSFLHYGVYADGDSGDLKVYADGSLGKELVGLLEYGGGGYAVAWIRNVIETEAFVIGIHEGEVVLERVSLPLSDDLGVSAARPAVVAS